MAELPSGDLKKQARPAVQLNSIRNIVPIDDAVDYMPSRSRSMKSHFWLMLGLWTGAILIMFCLDYWHLDQTLKKVALIEARAYLKKDEMTAHLLSFGLLWLLGIAGFWWAGARLSQAMRKFDETRIAEEKQAISELRASEKELKHFAAKLMQHQENERRTIALEIHEDIAQSLSAIKLIIESSLATDAHLIQSEPGVMISVIEQINEIIDLIRRLTKRLNPVMMETLGIKTAITVLCGEVMKSRKGCRITARIDIGEGRIPGELKIVVYRVLEDILKIAIPPGCDDHCTVTLAERDGNLVLAAGKSGRHALAPAKEAVKDPDLVEVRNRIESFGGSLQIESGAGDGCAITAFWPLPA